MAGNVKIDVDSSGISYFAGYIQGIAEEISGPTFNSAVLNYVHSNLNTKFELWMDALALARPKNLMHVYEWGQLGQPNGRLWESVMRGRGGERTSTVVWKASRKAVPVDPILTTPGKGGKAVKEGIHIFYWKAPVMEVGLTIRSEPKLAETMAFVDSSGNLAFRKKPVTFEAGGGKTRGQFTAAYATFWSTIAQSIYSQDIAPNLQYDIATLGKIKKQRRRRKSTLSSANLDFKRGENLGTLGLAKLTRNYEAAARARRAFLYGQ